MRFPYIAAACAILLAACAAPHPQSGETTPAPTPSAAPASAAPPARASASRASAEPVSTPVPVQNVPAAPVHTDKPQGEPGSGAVTPAPTETPLTLPPNAPPQIVNLMLNKTVVQSGETVSGTVETSSNVASVEARIANYSISVPKVAPGRFALTYDVPNVPFFLKRTYDMVVIARNTAGAETTRTIPITIR